jgi:hypothetical protein
VVETNQRLGKLEEDFGKLRQSCIESSNFIYENKDIFVAVKEVLENQAN